MDGFKRFMEQSFAGNTTGEYLIAAAVFIGSLIAIKLLKSIGMRQFRRFAEKTSTRMDNLVIDAIEKTIVPLLYFGAFYVALQGLSLNESLRKFFQVIGTGLFTYAAVRFVMILIRHLLVEVWAHKQDDVDRAQRSLKGLMPVIGVAIWGVGLVFFLDNLGFEIAAIMAGLGVGGIAIGLAAQAVLGDMFSYFSILFDKPFEIGDFLIVDDFLGSVEHIGIKTTRLRSLGGEQLVFSNSDLTGSRVKNYKRMQIRRIVFKLGVTYDTSLAKLKKGVTIVKDAIENTPNTKFDRAHFSSYGDFNLVIEAVYYVQSADYNVYMDTQQAINFAIKEAYEKEGIEFAFPTQTVHVAGSLTQKGSPNGRGENEKSEAKLA